MILLHYIVIGKFNSFRFSYEITTNENSSIGIALLKANENLRRWLRGDFRT